MTVDDLYASGLSAFARGAFDDAERLARAVVLAEDTHALGWQLWGVAALELGRAEEAVERLTRAVECDALLPDVHYNLALARAASGRRDLAIEGYRATLRLAPGHRSASINLANELRSDGAIDDAVEVLREAIARRPDDAELHRRLSRGLLEQGRPDAALVEATRAVRLSPDDPSPAGTRLFHRQYVPGVTAEQLLDEHRAWAERHFPTRPASTPAAVPHDDARPLRVGFVSPDLGYHPVGLFLAPLLERLPSRIETFCYSDRTPIDDQSRRLAGASTFLDVRGLDDDALERRIREDGVDVLFDLAGHTDHNRLAVFARRPAPVQVTWAGYVGTTGLPTMDWLLADRFHVPEGREGDFTERVIRMPHGYVCYEPPAYAPEVDPAPYRNAAGPTFGCFNNPCKINDAVLVVWAEILATIPGSLLVLKYAGCDQPVFRGRVTTAMAERGVDSSRLRFTGRTTHAEHLEALGRVDIALDPFPYSGGLSTLEATWMGVPVVTCPGSTFASRHAFGHLENAGAAGTVAGDLLEYVRIAVDLMCDPDRLATEHATLRDRMAESSACDRDGFAEAFATMLRTVVESHPRSG